MGLVGWEGLVGCPMPNPARPEWEVSQVLKFLASAKILALEDQEQEARNLDFLDGGHGQPLPTPAVSRGTHNVSTSEDKPSSPNRQGKAVIKC